MAKIKAKIPSKSGGKKEADDDGIDEEDMFADLGDLDALDAAANAREEGDDAQDYATDAEENLDDLLSGGDTSSAGHDVPELEADAFEDGEGDGIDLSDLGDMPDFDDDFDTEEDEEAATSAKKKKLLLLAGGGVAAAVMIGAASWLLLSGDGTQNAVEDAPVAVDLAANHDAFISLDNVPMAPQTIPGAAPEASVRADAPPPVQAPAEGQVAAGVTGDSAATEADVQPSALSKADRDLAALGLNVAQEPGVGVVVPSVTKASYANVSPAPPGEALSVAPVDILVEQTDVGLLPRVAEDGQTAFKAYARPAPQVDAAKPLVAVIVTGLGMSRAATEIAISAMPQNVTLSLDVYARGLDFWVSRAREDGHEVLLNMPLEAADFPFSDPGPEALKVLNAPEENIQKLQYILSRTTGYFGVLADHGSKFLADEDQVNLMMAQLKARGLMYVDGGAPGSLGTRSAYKINIPWAAVELNLDAAQSGAAFDLQLEEFSQLAQKRAVAIARVSATPLSMQRLSAWLGTLDQQGFQLVPVSALATKQLIR